MKIAHANLTEADQAVVTATRRDGIAVLPDLLEAEELVPLRAEFDQLHLDHGKGPGVPGVRGGV